MQEVKAHVRPSKLIHAKLVSTSQEVLVNEWQFQEAKVHFSEVVDRALKGEKQIVTKCGEKAVVVMAYHEYERLENKNKTLWDIFKTAPRMNEHDLPIVRDKTPIKPFELE